MIDINVTNFRKDIYSILENTIKFDETVNIKTKNGNAIIMSENDYNSLIETLYLSSNPYMKEKIIEGINTPVRECISENEVVW